MVRYTLWWEVRWWYKSSYQWNSLKKTFKSWNSTKVQSDHMGLWFYVINNWILCCRTTGKELSNWNSVMGGELQGYSGDEAARPKPKGKKRKFSWKISGLSKCSKSCGGGEFWFKYSIIIVVRLRFVYLNLLSTVGSNNNHS